MNNYSEVVQHDTPAGTMALVGYFDYHMALWTRYILQGSFLSH